MKVPMPAAVPMAAAAIIPRINILKKVIKNIFDIFGRRDLNCLCLRLTPIGE